MRVAAAVALLSSVSWGLSQTPPRRLPFVPVGVMDDRPAGGNRNRSDELRKLRFNVVARREASGVPGFRVESIPPATSTSIAAAGIEVVTIRSGITGAEVRRDAWIAIGRAFRGVIFDDWTRLLQNPDALDAASEFADVVTRNANLFAPLSGSSRTVRIDGATPDIFARFVESTDAIVLVAANLTAADQRVTLKFDPDLPEAIWQNMESGGAVNFVAGPEGPIYARTFPPHDVVVLAIRKQYK
jgi:hypothetical protein